MDKNTKELVIKRNVTIFKELNIRCVQVMVLLKQLFTWQGEKNVLQKAVSKENRHNQIQNNEKVRCRNVHFHFFIPDQELTQPVFCLFAVGFVSESLSYRESELQQIGKMHSFYKPKSQMQGLNRHSSFIQALHLCIKYRNSIECDEKSINKCLM